VIDLYAWGTTNGRRALVMLEESGLPFELHEVDIHKGGQKTPEYGKINPFRKIPAMIDRDGPGGAPATIFESVAICLYVGEKTGRFLGSPKDHPNVLKWTMFHATNVLCSMGLLGRVESPAIESASRAQLETMNAHLAGREWFAEEFSIADIVPFTRVNGVKHDNVKLSDYPNVVAWLGRVAGRPAVARAMARKFG
jgi:GST-like protein